MLLVAGQTGRAIVMLDQLEVGGDEEIMPLIEVVPSAVALAVPAFHASAPWIGAEEHALGDQGVVELSKYSRQFLLWNVE